MAKNETLARRLGEMLNLLNQGKRLDVNQLAEQFGVNLRTIQRDINDRLAFLDWEESGPRYYKMDRKKYGILSPKEIDRFALFASVADLFPKIDRAFYQEKLIESVKIKGFQYEDIRHLEKEFSLLKNAIEQHQFIHFNYTKSGQISGKFYKIAPYSLINKNGIWYLIGTDSEENDKQKTFCFTQISMPRKLDETFEPNQQLLAEINRSDSIYHGNQISEVVVQVSKDAAPYFLRRPLLPNQKLLHQLENGGLLLANNCWFGDYSEQFLQESRLLLQQANDSRKG